MRPSKYAPLALALVAGACATSGLPSGANVAIIGSEAAFVDTIDERDVRDEAAGVRTQARFEILPGPHTIEVSLDAGSFVAKANEGAKTIAVCFSAVGGHSYRAQPVFAQGRWRPEIIDEDTGGAVQVGCTQPRDLPTIAETAPAVSSSAADQTASAPAVPPEPTPTPAPPAAPPAAPAPAPAAPASLPVLSIAPRRHANLPGSGVNASLGFCFGGEALYQVTFTEAPDRTLSAGRGVQVSLGGLWTPLWSDDYRVGFGVGASAAWKYDSIEAINGRASLRRFPLALSVHSLIRFDERWFALVSGGPTTELGGHMSADGFFGPRIDADLSSTWGLFGEGALYYDVDHFALGAGLRYSRLRAWFMGTKYDASSLGIIGSAQYGF
jgi:hypothetical protein